MPEQSREFSINLTNFWIPDPLTKTFIKSKTAVIIVTTFRKCKIGELYTIVDSLFECTPCPDGRYSIVEPSLQYYLQ